MKSGVIATRTGKRIDDYQPVMQQLYNAASKYPDQNLAKAIGEVRDLMVCYRNQLMMMEDQPCTNSQN